ncbi:acyl carrier protein phosphodiesterase [Malonomonas rubra]|uniref:acyl carrier protein phosphodiesterase n=1 Tax=Malonomonas rubra TaxID=57040 RepID=UPI0026F189D0|nr:acyl carrier protein phosphodiesterase [Malonomonas rubra]
MKGPVSGSLPEELARHLRLHRRIDTYTTVSQSFQSSRQRLDPRFRYARGILVDVFYDHFLACHWDRYSSRPLAEFAQDVYRGLQSCYPLLPESLQQQLPRMIEYDWLTSYRDQDVVLRVLQRLEDRLRNKFPLAEGYSEMIIHRSGLEADFADFMKELSAAIIYWD